MSNPQRIRKRKRCCRCVNSEDTCMTFTADLRDFAQWFTFCLGGLSLPPSQLPEQARAPLE